MIYKREKRVLSVGHFGIGKEKPNFLIKVELLNLSYFLSNWILVLRKLKLQILLLGFHGFYGGGEHVPKFPLRHFWSIFNFYKFRTHLFVVIDCFLLFFVNQKKVCFLINPPPHHCNWATRIKWTSRKLYTVLSIT